MMRSSRTVVVMLILAAAALIAAYLVSSYEKVPARVALTHQVPLTVPFKVRASGTYFVELEIQSDTLPVTTPPSFIDLDWQILNDGKALAGSSSPHVHAGPFTANTSAVSMGHFEAKRGHVYTLSALPRNVPAELRPAQPQIYVMLTAGDVTARSLASVVLVCVGAALAIIALGTAIMIYRNPKRGATDTSARPPV